MGREAFRDAADYLVNAAHAVPDNAWGAPGLGEWNVRDLLGHACRSFLTFADYVSETPPSEVEVANAIEYFAWFQQIPAGDHAAITQRGRDAGAALGADPVAATVELRARALDALDAAPDDRVMKTAAGGMLVHEYLRTRTFELVVHTIDLRHAIGRPVEPPASAAAEVLEILSALTVRGKHVSRVVAMLTGRVDAARFSLL